MTKAQALLEEIKNLKKLPAGIRSKLNNDLHPIGAKYHDKIPLADIEKILAKYGIIMLQEDGTKWEGMFLGREGRDKFDIGYEASKDGEIYIPIENSVLVMSWYKMDSGRYEVNPYIS